MEGALIAYLDVPAKQIKRLQCTLAIEDTSSCASFSDPDMNPANGGGFLGKIA